MVRDLEFWRGKRVFLTGHTGFKGAWLCRVLTQSGADLTGYALEPPTDPNLFSICGASDKMASITGDIRDSAGLMAAFRDAAPEIVIHMAAQPIVREGYKDPADTYETNVMGTVNILECVRLCGGVKSFLNVTTDKVYQNNEWEWGYRETDPLDGFDPYSNSKSCSELVTHSYRNSFFADGKPAVSTARAGNVIGGGDFAGDRIIPDCVRAAIKKESVIIRNPHSVRPYQHVLEPLFAYLTIARRQYEDAGFAGYYNVGPDDRDCVSTGTLADLFCRYWGDGLRWEAVSDDGPHEAHFLKLDCSRMKTAFHWQPRWHIEEAIEKTVAWTKAYLRDSAICEVMDQQIAGYLGRP
ncbi:MAG: CDP-glucose 4,6-dehydratase [Clostridiales bacterium]|nr:CDP-glucose 4,6-dehydratase [Clostridiales bacterium]